MEVIKDNQVPGALPRAATPEWGQTHHGLSIAEILKVVSTFCALEPPRSYRPFLGPILNLMRKWMWRLIGMKPMHQQITVVMSQILISRLAFRTGTEDQPIFFNVVVNNEYCLPETFAPDDIVIDIGMHIGSFCFAALLRGCTNVHGFEAERENFNLAVRNLQGFSDRVHIYHKAVWRSDRTGDALFSGQGNAEGNTGGGCILYDTRGEKLDL